MYPGAKFSTRMSDPLAIRLNSCFPFSCRRLRVTALLFRAYMSTDMLSPLGATGPTERSSSPPGRSIRITSAPMSDSSMQQWGPLMNRVRSRTRIPSNGCATDPPIEWPCACHPAAGPWAGRPSRLLRTGYRAELGAPLSSLQVWRVTCRPAPAVWPPGQ